MQFKGGGFRVIIVPSALSDLNRHRQSPADSESGGLILGYLFSDRLEVIEIVPPSAFDLAAPRSFVRSRHRAQQAIDEAWGRSQGRLNYVGEWHSHSEHAPSPSQQDKRMADSALRTTQMELDTLVMVIVGMRGKLWVGVQTPSNLLPLIVSS